MAYREREDGKRWWRCGVCRTRRATSLLLTLHRKAHPECKACTCEGSGMRHRPGSRYCLSNPMHEYHHAKRAGASEEELFDVLLDLALRGIGGKVSDECPF